MKLIEKYSIQSSGYHPFLIRDGWQVAQLNYMPEQALKCIKQLDVHHQTDEVFVLTKGQAVLIAAQINGDELLFEVELMQAGQTYNIPARRWHNIVMTEGCKMIIVEKSNTHLNDVDYLPLSIPQIDELRGLVLKALSGEGNL